MHGDLVKAEVLLRTFTGDSKARLTPVQRKSVEAGIMNEAGVSLFSATGNGKTFALVLAAAGARADGRILYVATTRAVAEEKAADFARWSGADGVILCTGERTEADQRLAEGDFRLAVVTVEKLIALLASGRRRAWRISTAVIDELHLLADASRGPGMDFLLTTLKRMDPKPQIVTLSPVVENAREIAEWLGTRAVVERERFVELRKGTLERGTFAYTEHNSGRRGEETFADGDDFSVVEELAVKRKEPTLVLLPTKHEADMWARSFRERVSLPACAEALDDLKELPDSAQRDRARENFASSVGVHHADEPALLRAIVERQARAGRLRVVVATSTLGSGVHMPFRNVLIRPERYAGRSQFPLMTPVEFDNAAGRAGRPGFGGGPGRAMVMVTGAHSADSLRAALIETPMSALRPLPGNLTDRAFKALAVLRACTVGELEDFLKESFGSRVAGPPAPELLESALEALDAVAARHGERIGLTKLGIAAARSGIRAATAVQMRAWCDAHAEGAIEPVEVLLALACCPDGEEIAVSMRRDEEYSACWEAVLKATAPARLLAHPDVARLIGPRAAYGANAALKKALTAHAWSRRIAHRDLEEQFATTAGAAERLSHEFAWLLDALARIAGACGWSDERCHELRSLAGDLRHADAPAAPRKRAKVKPPSVAAASPAGSGTVVIAIPGVENPSGAVPMVRINGVVHHPEERIFATLLGLVLALKRTDDGWVRDTVFGGQERAHTAIYETREFLKAAIPGVDGKKFIPNHRRAYRLNLDPGAVEVDPAGVARIIPGLLPKIEASLKLKPDGGGA
jgi:helicase